MDATELLAPYRVVPVVVINDASTAVPLAETLVAAGIGVIEVTLRTDAALAAIEAIAAKVPDMLVGAGSLRTTSQFDDVANAGAKFGVSPGSTTALVKAAKSRGLPYVPGAATPSEMLALFEQGIRLQKFFPAEAAGGIPMLKSVASPLPDVSFMPTGGIDVELAKDYLALPNVAGVGGSWLAPASLVSEANYDEIGRIARDAAKLGV
ncbi:MAG: bifunctional 4-hydroxy-2-oxoglutarate aldolase/2-dehydro-3-deoxy-phosphogluconate aldolase [Woeseiaceae bacterium]|nr:bifunctional 4-hydroxy-2-oxoglutarate aldolase/2-dehydro-3-deoxy-phosphogluconate aldolase [Woeseiaceae bacterium]